MSFSALWGIIPNLKIVASSRKDVDNVEKWSTEVAIFKYYRNHRQQILKRYLGGMELNEKIWSSCTECQNLF